MDLSKVLNLNVKQLRVELRSVGLDNLGKKAELQQRLYDYYQNHDPDQNTSQPSSARQSVGEPPVDSQADQRAKLASLELEIEILKKQRELDLLQNSGSGDRNSNSDIKEAMIEAVYASQVEIIQPSVFNGDPLKYTMWKIQFQSVISSPRIRQSDRLNVLAKYLSGKALNVVQHLFFIPGDNFDTAMKLLEDRFGDSYVISEAFRNKLSTWPMVRPNDTNALLELSDFVKQCVEVKRHVPGLAILDDGQENQKLLRRLPWWFIAKWREKIVDYKESCNNQYPPFEMFSEFLQNRAKVASEPITAALASKSDSNPKQSQNTKAGNENKSKTSLATQSQQPQKSQTTDSETKKVYPCKFCNSSDHHLHECSKFTEIPWAERHEFVSKARLCFSCLRFGHAASKCRRRHTCSTCNKSHPTCLHKDTAPESKESGDNSDKDTVTHVVETKDNAQSDVVVNLDVIGQGGDYSTTIVPVWLSSKQDPEKEILVYALVDSMSDISFVLDDVYEQLNSDYDWTNLKLKTMASPCTRVPSKLSHDLQIRSFYDSKYVSLPQMYSRSFIPANTSAIPHRGMVEQWPHLVSIASQVPTLQDCPVGLLIGYKVLQAFIPRGYIAGGDNEPFGLNTDIGWKIMGPDHNVRLDCDNIGISHLMVTLPVSDGQRSFDESHAVKSLVNFKCSQPVRETFSQQILYALESDFHDVTSEKCISQNDLKFLSIMKTGISQDENNHYCMPLPFKNPVALPNNRDAVLKRLMHLKQKLSRDDSYKAQYFKFMTSMIQNGEAEPVPAEPLNPGQSWYIPHFGVKHQRKDKIRVVFDCSAKNQGISLNDCLLPGPDHINSLVGILMRFRLNNIALMCDIEKMFHQFSVTKSHRDFLRFIWFSDENMNYVQDYRMTVHLFGATSSPACATYGLRAIAKDYCDMNDGFSVLARDFITHDFYVDDGIASVSDVQTACEIAKHAREICSKAGIRLHKFMSNSLDVVDSVPVSERADSIQGIDLSYDALPVERTLGVIWSVENDEFQFSVKAKVGKQTRREVLSVVASVYDPLGWLAPFILRGKHILQDVCTAKLSWDDELTPEFRSRWEVWLKELQKICEIKVPRQYWSGVNPFTDMKTVEIHHFSDACETGYGQCSYMRMISHENEIKCCLIMGKARVTPKKVVTIPRLELQAAVTSVKIAQQVMGELRNENLRQVFWTDSTAVLGYISNEARQFHVYVANRVQKVRDYTSPDQWYYVKSKDNPADIASRSCNVSNLTDTWFNGPRFLYDSQLDLTNHRNTNSDKYVLCDSDPEVKTVLDTVDITSAMPTLYDRILDISEWGKMIAVAQVFLRKANSKSDVPLDAIELKQKSQLYIIRNAQKEAFSEEISLLKSKTHVKLPKSSALYGLNPILDCDGILRIGGRCSKARWEYSEKHPAILPRLSHVTNAIVRHIHAKCAHQGRNITVNSVRSHGFWVIGLSRVVSRIIHYCVTCRKERGYMSIQKMADLPPPRIEETPPFTAVGCDCFGPFMVNESRKQLKKYGVVYTCLYSRAIHIELLDDLSTDSFMNSFRCITAIRGNIRQIFCDRGTNFIGASSALKEAWKEIMNPEMVSMLSKYDCEFVFNPPAASHMGGVWERQIRTIRSVLTNLLNKHPCRVNTSELRTLFYECMSIVNSRPLSVENLYDPHSRPITPNHLVTMKSEVIVSPPGHFSEPDIYARKRWKKIQYLADQFWKQWKSQYISNIQKRSKWNDTKPNLKEDSIVLISDENAPRNMWKLGRVVECSKGSDGLIRKVRLFTGVISGRQQFVERPIHRLVVLLE